MGLFYLKAHVTTEERRERIARLLETTAADVRCHNLAEAAKLFDRARQLLQHEVNYESWIAGHRVEPGAKEGT